MIAMTLGDIALAVEAPCDPRFRGVQVRRVITDSREARSGDLFFALRGPRFDGHDYITAAAARGSVAWVGCASVATDPTGPSADRTSIPGLVVRDSVAALGRLAAHYRRYVLKPENVVIAVTGSNGKTTTKCMIDHVLGGTFAGRASPKSFNNEIGVPLTLLSADDGDRYIVVEIGTNAPGEVAALADMASPNAAVITSVGEAHLQRLGSVEAVAAEKASLLDRVSPGGLVVVNVDRPEIRPHVHRNPRVRVMTVGTDPSAQLRVSEVKGTIHATRFVLDGRFRVELPMPGMHHATNAAAAFALGRWFGVAPDEICSRLRSFVPPAGRTRTQVRGGVTMVDDTYNANPASVSSAIRTLSRAATGRRIFVLGDMLELGGQADGYHRRAVEEAVNSGLEVLITIGEQTERAVAECASSTGRTEVLSCPDRESADRVLAEWLRPGDTVWVKASRAVQLDWLVERWEARGLPAVAVA
jgi:UDP-N-acetylmuramoyl-tripeptide--D-alanyl-D-alanine ligase